MQSVGSAAVFRTIPSEVLAMDQLGMGDIFRKISNVPRGLVVVTGPTGSGKSTSLYAALKEIKSESVNWQSEYTDYILEGVAVFSSYVKEWYSGNLQKVFFARPENPIIKKKICAVLAGYVWDKTNTFVTRHKKKIKKNGSQEDSHAEKQTNDRKTKPSETPRKKPAEEKENHSQLDPKQHTRNPKTS
mgnify:CR=1 FL=1